VEHPPGSQRLPIITRPPANYRAFLPRLEMKNSRSRDLMNIGKMLATVNK
jgi:hypothetical protein